MAENDVSSVAKANRWRVQFEAWKTSGLSVRVYCKGEGIGLNSFRYWQRKLEGSGKPQRLVKVPVRIAAQVAPFEIVVGGRFTVRLANGFRTEELERLVGTLEKLR